jgi:hypothetical protein
VSIFKVKDWPQREEFVPGQANIKNLPLVNPKKSKNVLLPPSQIKLGLIKHFVKVLDTESAAFQN